VRLVAAGVRVDWHAGSFQLAKVLLWSSFFVSKDVNYDAVQRGPPVFRVGQLDVAAAEHCIELSPVHRDRKAAWSGSVACDGGDLSRLN
jgi:hypothetical protein